MNISFVKCKNKESILLNSRSRPTVEDTVLWSSVTFQVVTEIFPESFCDSGSLQLEGLAVGVSFSQLYFSQHSCPGLFLSPESLSGASLWESIPQEKRFTGSQTPEVLASMSPEIK